MPKGFQAIKFVMLDFDEFWERSAPAAAYTNVRYTALKKGARLAVVFEDYRASMHTYRYELAAKAEVFVLDQVIHVPARFIRDEPENTIKSDG